MAPRDDIAALAKNLGIASSYFDQSEERVEIAADTQLALMEALGYPASTASELRDSIQRLADLRNGPLPPWTVLEAGRASRLDLPKAFASEAKAWRISGEDGSAHEGQASGRLELPQLEAGYYQLEVEAKGRPARSFLIVAPSKCWAAPEFANGDSRGWGLTAQVYGLRSERNYGVGDFADVANLARAAERHGASFLGLSPLHALFASDRSKISPYSPSSRLFIEPLYLAPDLIDAEPAEVVKLRTRIQELRAAPLVDYREAWEVKRRLLESLYENFLKTGGGEAFSRKRAAFGEELELHATFEALSEHFSAQGHNWPGVWPSDYFDSSSPVVARFRRDHAERISFHAWLQVLCDEQLERAARASRMELGLYRDLAVGADRYGSEVWSRPDRYALSLSVGAPPDPLGPQGQNWGFPPFNPITLERQDFAAFRDLVCANMRHAGAIRIDHAFQLERLFLVPPGKTAAHGGYVDFPFEALLAILRLESQRNRCMVIAEDLGTGPEGFSEAIMNSGILSYRILSFERNKDGGFVAPKEYPRDALAAITTHDLPTFKGWRRGFDIDLRSHFGVYDEDHARSEQDARARDVACWREALKKEGLSGEMEPERVSRNEALTYLARTPSVLLAVQIEDLLDEINQANLPGLSDGPPNWRRRMSESIERFAAAHGPLGKAGALMAEEERTPRRREARLAAPPPRATYRLQFHAGFTFDMAREILPYLKKLGISHVYASPIQKARKGSTHGYDIFDPREINPELGGRSAFDRFEEELHALGLKLIIDIVPNHMGVGPENPFWRSVLQWGERSPHACVFDIDFRRGGGRVMLPVLGRPYGEALEAGELKLSYDMEAGFSILYFESAFPVSPHSYARLLGPLLHGHEFEKHGDELRDALALLTSPRDFSSALERIGRVAKEPRVAAAIRRICQSVTDDVDKLDALMQEQCYRLAYWRLAGSDINYRRFFEINTLAGVRVEDEGVLAMTHELVFELVDKGQVDGLRIDHIDGLADPKTYLRRLQERLGPGFYILAEKILERGERLKAWPLAGTTGYDALNELDGILVDRSAREAFERFYRDVVGERSTYDEALTEAKSAVLEQSFGAECEKLAEGLLAAAQGHRSTQDIGLASFRRVSKAALVALPVYRTYVGPEGADAADAELIRGTMERVRARALPADKAACDFLERLLSGRERGAESARLRVAFEQLTGPVMAKGLEDTLFYRHAPFLALNEVGADPSHFGFTLEEFHAAAAERAQHWPASLITTATHDTKRGEDARARLFALTAEPEIFFEEASRFLDLAEGPDRNDAFILLQSLIGAWPVHDEQTSRDEFHDRARAFFLKAMREAKRHSSWTDPDEAYEKRALDCLDHVLKGREPRDIVERLAERAAWPGALNGLARTVLKLTLPGVPDFYQGAGRWDHSFVDPDNRRPVDFEQRLKFLEQVETARPQDLLSDWRDGRVKQWIVSQLLADRAAHAEFFALAGYEPKPSEFGVAFERRLGDERLYVRALTGTDMSKRKLLGASGGFSADAPWLSEKVSLAPGRWRNLLIGSAFAVEGAVTCAEIAGGLPWLILGKWHE